MHTLSLSFADELARSLRRDTTDAHLGISDPELQGGPTATFVNTSQDCRAIGDMISAVIVATFGAITPFAVMPEDPPAMSISVLRDYALQGRVVPYSLSPSSGSSCTCDISSMPTVDDVYRAMCDTSIAQTMLTPIYRMVEAGQTRKAMVATFRAVNDAISAGDTAACDRLLRTVEVTKLDADTTVAFLSSTYPARASLPSRPAMYERAFNHLASMIGIERAHDVADRMR
jgi:hypothetical protein